MMEHSLWWNTTNKNVYRCQSLDASDNTS